MERHKFKLKINQIYQDLEMFLVKLLILLDIKIKIKNF